MKQAKKVIWICLLMIGINSSAQTTNTNIEAKYKFDTLRPSVKKRFEEKLNKIIKAKFVNLDELEYIDDFLVTKEDALAYVLAIFKIKFPDYENPESLKINIDEDKTKKLWFIYITPPFVTYGGELFVIIVKNNCRIIYFEKTK